MNDHPAPPEQIIERTYVGRRPDAGRRPELRIVDAHGERELALYPLHAGEMDWFGDPNEPKSQYELARALTADTVGLSLAGQISGLAYAYMEIPDALFCLQEFDHFELPALTVWEFLIEHSSPRTLLRVRMEEAYCLLVRDIQNGRLTQASIERYRVTLDGLETHCPQWMDPIVRFDCLTILHDARALLTKATA